MPAICASPSRTTAAWLPPWTWRGSTAPRGYQTIRFERRAEWLDPERDVAALPGLVEQYVVDVRRGQKTGTFLDQRENRLLVRGLSRGRRDALNCFSYTGGFSIAAALGGAARVVSVDLDADAVALAGLLDRLHLQRDDVDRRPRGRLRRRRRPGCRR